MKFILKILLNATAVYLAAYILEPVMIPDFSTALLVGLVLGVLNLTIKPLVRILTLPINILSLGIFGLVLNGLFLYLVTFMVEGFIINGFLYAVLASMLISFLVAIFELIIGYE